MARKMMWFGIFMVLTLLLSSFTVLLPEKARADDGERIDQYTTRIIDKNGQVVYREVVPGSPPSAVPMKAASLPEPDIQGAANSLTGVPSSTWAYGCSATSAAMLAGYYDQPARGYTNIYTGPTSGGVFPLTNTSWGSTYYPATCGSATTCGNNPLAATKNGVDGRATKGYVDDYWQAVDCTGDPYTSSWTPHADDCLGDYMGTSQWVKNGNAYNNEDGGTGFYYGSNNTPLYDYTACEPGYRDGCHGIKLFLQSRGYTVTSNYSQRISGFNGISAGFTYDQFKAEIDAGRPVIIQIYGHTMLGYGYSDPSTIAIRNTWYNSEDTMTWGGTWQGRQHRGVTVVQLAPISTASSITVTSPASGNTWAAGTTHAITWTCQSISDTYVKIELYTSSPSAFSSTIASYTTASSGTYSWPIPTTQAGNTYFVRVSTTYGSQSVIGNSGTFTISPQAEKYAVIVGINQYSSPSNNLYYCVNDANDIKNGLIAKGWQSSHITVLLDTQATKTNIQNAITTMKNSAGAGDLCLYAHSSHGSSYGGVEYLCTTNLSSTSQWISDSELDTWLSAISANKVVMLDTCFSGGFVKANLHQAGVDHKSRYYPMPPSAVDPNAIARGGFSRALNKSGFVALAACDVTEYSWESSSIQNGYFTYYAVQGLAGPADTNGNGVSAEEVFSYASPRVTAAVSSQHPQIYDGVTGEVLLTPP